VEVKAERTHTVVVTDCGPADVVVQGKPKILLVDKATAVGLVVEGCICGCEVVNCRDLKLSVAKMVPSLMVDKSSNISIVFPTIDALDTQIVWCNAEAVSVQFKAANDAEPSEFATVVTRVTRARRSAMVRGTCARSGCGTMAEGKGCWQRRQESLLPATSRAGFQGIQSGGLGRLCFPTCGSLCVATLPVAATALLERPAGVDPRRQMVSKFEKAPTGAFVLVTRPFELFDDDAYMGMARSS
jgi:hypothetical protein